MSLDTLQQIYGQKLFFWMPTYNRLEYDSVLSSQYPYIVIVSWTSKSVLNELKYDV